MRIPKPVASCSEVAWSQSERCHLSTGTARVLLECPRVRLSLNLHSRVAEAHREIRVVSIIFDPWNPKYCCLRSTETHAPQQQY